MEKLQISDIREIISLLEDHRKWYQNLLEHEKPPLGHIWGYFEKEKPALLRLSGLDRFAFQEIAALMWLGRGDGKISDWDVLVSSGKSVDPSYVLEKSPLIEYLLEGLKLLGLIESYHVNVSEYSERRLADTFSVADFSKELYQFLQKNPKSIYDFTPRRFEELINDILRRMGYETHLTKQTRDGGRDILAYFDTPLGKTLTIVDCKRYAPERKIGIAQVERFLYAVDRKDDASMGMIVTSSEFSRDAKEIEKLRPFRLQLKDFEHIKDWLDFDGQRYEQEDTGLWLPN